MLTSTIPPWELALSGDLVPLLGGGRAATRDLVPPLGGARAVAGGSRDTAWGSSCRWCRGARRSPTELGCYGQGAVAPSTAGNDIGPALCAVEAAAQMTAGVAGSGRTRTGRQTSETVTRIISARWWPGRGPSGWDPPAWG